MDISYIIGGALMIAGIAIYLGGKMRHRNTSVRASNNSIAVGGKNTGTITNTVTGHNPAPAHGGGHSVTIVAILVELVGIGVTIWHAMHLAAK